MIFEFSFVEFCAELADGGNVLLIEELIQHFIFFCELFVEVFELGFEKFVLIFVGIRLDFQFQGFFVKMFLLASHFLWF